MDKSKQIERKIEKIKNAVMKLGNMCLGSLTAQPSSWSVNIVSYVILIREKAAPTMYHPNRYRR